MWYRVWPVVALLVSCLFVITGNPCVGSVLWGEYCPVPVLVQCGTVVVGWSGTGGTLWAGVGVVGGTLRYRTVPCMFGMDGYERYKNVPYRTVKYADNDSG